jgi:hypothetical protein
VLENDRVAFAHLNVGHALAIYLDVLLGVFGG